MPSFNDRIKQVLLLGLILLLVCLIITELRLFLPGLLGALTLYILSRASYFKLVYQRKWKPGRAAGLFILYYLFLLGLPIFLAVTLVSPKINQFLADPNAMLDAAKHSLETIQQRIGFTLVSEALIERTLNRIIPLKQDNINTLAHETKRMVRANALGIPLISIIQGLTATLGYFIFQVPEWGLWGFLTGVFAFFPVVGTMVVWVPLSLYMFATGDTWMATGMTLYSIIVTGNVDYFARITLLKKMGDVHPVITILGVLVGLGLFGFIGLIFGPLLISYVLVLFDIYMNEFSKVDGKLTEKAHATPEEKNEDI